MLPPSNLITPLQNLEKYRDNHLFVKRDDLYPFSFGGNKARKGTYFWKEFRRLGADCLVTYGSFSSNHVRVIANIAASEQVPCVVIAPLEESEPTFNSIIAKQLGANIVTCPVAEVAATIDQTLEDLKAQGKTPYFIPGGGHDILGTQAYVDCYNEIFDQLPDDRQADYIFCASGTGTTQAGLLVGSLIKRSMPAPRIVGLSIARTSDRGRSVILDAAVEYVQKSSIAIDETAINSHLIFCDEYRAGGYAKTNPHINSTVNRVMRTYGIALNPTYTGKAWWGMDEYLKHYDIQDATIVFVHTGGTPLYFDYLSRI